MSQLSPKAMRFVELALAQQGDERQRTEWQSWIRYSDTELPSHVAQVALHALSGMALTIEDRIAQEDTDAITAARLENDLGYIAEIEAVLSHLLYEPVRSYA
jgi:hypothetical protein